MDMVVLGEFVVVWVLRLLVGIANRDRYQNSIGCARTVAVMIQDRRGNAVIKSKI